MLQGGDNDELSSLLNVNRITSEYIYPQPSSAHAKRGAARYLGHTHRRTAHTWRVCLTNSFGTNTRLLAALPQAAARACATTLAAG